MSEERTTLGRRRLLVLGAGVAAIPACGDQNTGPGGPYSWDPWAPGRDAASGSSGSSGGGSSAGGSSSGGGSSASSSSSSGGAGRGVVRGFRWRSGQGEG